MSDTLVHTTAAMGTVVTLQVVGHGATDAERLDRADAVARAAGWFSHVSDACTRFDPRSELSRLTAQVGVAVPVSDVLYEAVGFAIMVAEASDGAFDPTVGARMEDRGFNREFRSDRVVRTGISRIEAASFRDIHLEPVQHTITLDRQLLLDLGAVAKGLAIDLAARELSRFANFAIDAGGDLYLGGHNDHGQSWSVGIRHPRDPAAVLATIALTDMAICTSGDYERHGTNGEHHLIDPRSGESSARLASATVLARSAMVADALATAAFVLGPVQGLAFLEQQGVEGLLVTPQLEQHATAGMPRG